MRLAFDLAKKYFNRLDLQDQAKIILEGYSELWNVVKHIADLHGVTPSHVLGELNIQATLTRPENDPAFNAFSVDKQQPPAPAIPQNLRDLFDEELKRIEQEHGVAPATTMPKKPEETEE